LSFLGPPLLTGKRFAVTLVIELVIPQTEDFMNSLVKKMLIASLMSVSVFFISYSGTWGNIAQKCVTEITRTTKAGTNLALRCLPEGFAGRATVIGMGVGSAALCLSCYKVAAISLAIGSAAGYLNHLYHKDRIITGYARIDIPGGAMVEEPIYEPLYAWAVRKWSTRHNLPATNPYARKSWFGN